MTTSPERRPTALVTGASAGLGLCYAKQLAARGYNLVIVARNAEALDELAGQLTLDHGVEVEVLVADLAQRDSLALVSDRLSDQAQPVDLLVNNAGYGLKQSVATGEIDLLEQHFDVLARAVLVLSNAAAKAMVSRRRGHILNVGSVAGLLAGGGHYSALKAYVLALTESLARDLAGTGVTATVVLPGYVHTEFHARAGMQGGSKDSRAWLAPVDVVNESLQALFAGRLIVVPSRRYRLLVGLLDVLPRGAIRLGWRIGSTKAPSRTAEHSETSVRA